MVKKEGSKVKNIILAVAIAIIFAFFVNIGIEAFFPSPDYEDFCNQSFEIENRINTEMDCESKGGVWEEFGGTTEEFNCQQIGELNGTYTLSCNKIYAKPNGFCDINHKCNTEYSESNESYSRILFIITLIIGISTIVLSITLKLASVSSGLMAGGVIVIIVGLMKYWQFSSDVLRFTLLGIILAILIWLGYKKLSK